MNEKDRFFLAAAFAAVRSIQILCLFVLGSMIVFSLAGQGCLPGIIAVSVLALLAHDRPKDKEKGTS